MICARCARCADAADQHAGPDAHCTSHGGPSSGCDCQHRTDRYRTTEEQPDA